MDRSEEHIVAAVEDVLGAIAVVVVDIEDGNLAPALVEECLGGDGGVVQVAVATITSPAAWCPGGGTGKGAMRACWIAAWR